MKKRKILSMLLAAAMVLSLLPVSAMAATDTGNTLLDAAIQAGEYEYSGEAAYEYTGTFVYSYNSSKTTMTITGAYSAEGMLDGSAMNDMARYLGALYRQDDGNTVKRISYNEVDYTWDTEGTLQGSNWKNADTTLVAAIVADFTENSQLANVQLTLKDESDGTLTLTFAPTTGNALAGAIDAADAGDIVVLGASINVVSKLVIDKKITLDGNGYTVTAAENWTGSDNSSKHLLGIEGNSAAGTEIKNITLDSTNIAYGLQPYDVGGVIYLNNVILKNSKGTGMTVNGSSVDADQLTISGSGWQQSIDVSNGVGIEGSPMLTLTNSTLQDPIGIFEDISESGAAGNDATVTVDNVTYKAFERQIGENYKLIYLASMPVMIGENGYWTLAEAVSAAGTDNIGTTITLTSDITLTEKLTINKNVTINGQDHTIAGNAGDAGVYIEVTGGTFDISNVTLEDFGGAAGTQSGNGVIKVPSNATGVTVNATNVNIQDFNRSAYDIGAGSFAISGGTIDCANSNTAGTVLTKGIKVGGTANKVTGVISGVTIKNSASKYEDWNTAAIEIYSNADVDITNCTIFNVSKGIHVDNYWFSTGAITVDISGGSIAADADAVMIYSKDGATNSVHVNISGGAFTGDVRILDKTDNDTITITGGTFSSDPGDYVADGYVVSGSGPYTVSRYVAPSVPSTPSTPDQTETVTNPDGSVTTTVTKPDGSMTQTTQAPDGSSSVVSTGKDGQVEAQVDLSAAALAAAAQAGEAAALPMPAVTAASETDSAAAVTVSLPAGVDRAVVEIPVADVTAGVVAVRMLSDGTEEIIKTSVPTGDGLALQVSDGDTVKIVDNAIDFADVSDTYWGADAIDFVSSRELFAGTSATTFDPNADMTRAMIVTVLARYVGVDTSVGDTWYAAGAQWAVSMGISDGTDLDSPVTREQLVTMLYRYAGQPAVTGDTSAFTDSDDVSDWAADAMAWAIESGIIAGMGNNTLAPQGFATRAQVATILMRFITAMV